MSQNHCYKQFTRVVLLVLWMSTVSVNSILAADLEVNELIDSIRSHVLTAEKRAREQPLFGIKEVKLTISYAIEKKGEGGFKLFVITAGASISSHAVQTMEFILTPLKDMKVEKQRPEGGAPRFAERGHSYTVADLSAALFQEDSPHTRGAGPVRPPWPEKASLELNEVFEPNSSEILPKYYPDLDKLGVVLMVPQHREYLIAIEGHTDSLGSESYNQRLSERRAESVKRYLIQHFSIDPQRLIARGYGQSKPRASNDTPEGRYLNRRIEIVNLGKG